jgi:aryl-alcohol dehydrogenase-like predicted oxidoreductase
MKTSLPTRSLGTTGLELTKVGFGSWAIGGPGWRGGWGAQDDTESVESIRHAVELGINWIDTAAVYGLGHSEEIVRMALADIPAADRPLVFTKGGMAWDPNNPAAGIHRSGARSSVRKNLEDSLRRLGVEQIDLYQMHWPAEDGTPIEEYWAEFVAMREAGTVRAIGLSNHSVELLERAEAIGHIDSLQPPLSAINDDAVHNVLPWCVEHSTGVIAYSPMGSGLLTGAFTAERVAALPTDDWRHAASAFTTDLESNLRVADAFARIAERYGVPQPAAAAAWAIAQVGVTGAIVGARSADQVDGWIDAASLTLTETDLAEVASARV